MTDRSALQFPQRARDAFQFLTDAGFAVVETSPTLVRYSKDEVEIDIYHGRQSYEIGGGVTLAGTRYAMSEIIRSADFELANRYRDSVATTPDEIDVGLERLAGLMRYCNLGVLRAEQQFIATLERLRTKWAEEYALDVLAVQLRPQADEAFRRGAYEEAAKLYGQFRERLSSAEAKKLSLAQKRSSDRT
jgi:hypothetical protein